MLYFMIACSQLNSADAMMTRLKLFSGRCSTCSVFQWALPNTYALYGPVCVRTYVRIRACVNVHRNHIHIDRVAEPWLILYSILKFFSLQNFNILRKLCPMNDFRL